MQVTLKQNAFIKLYNLNVYTSNLNKLYNKHFLIAFKPKQHQNANGVHDNNILLHYTETRLLYILVWSNSIKI